MNISNYKEDNSRESSKYNSIQTVGLEINGIPLKALQKCELDILAHFISVCKKYGLRYYLAGGTLLGAVRHGGFIPWDDDVDIVMPRADYDRFIGIASQYDDQYELLNCHTEIKYKPLYTKYMNSNTTAIWYDRLALRKKHGVWIDIFPLDIAPKSYLLRRIQFLQERLLDVCINHYISDGHFTKSTANPMNKAFKYCVIYLSGLVYPLNQSIMKKENLFRSFCKKDTGYVCNYAGRRILLLKSVFGDGITIEFEGIPARVPARYDIWLEKLYGPDYMTIPPVEKQKLKHKKEFDILDLNHSYHEYVDSEGNLL